MGGCVSALEGRPSAPGDVTPVRELRFRMCPILCLSKWRRPISGDDMPVGAVLLPCGGGCPAEDGGSREDSLRFEGDDDDDDDDEEEEEEEARESKEGRAADAAEWMVGDGSAERHPPAACGASTRGASRGASPRGLVICSICASQRAL